MKPHRPVAVLVIAIFHFIVGGLSILWELCTFAGLGMIALFANTTMPKQPAGQPNPFELFQSMLDIPGYVPVVIVHTTLGLIWSIVLIAAGIGLLKMQSWARWTSIACGAYGVISATVMLIYTLVIYNPAMEEIRTKMTLGKAQGGGPAQDMIGAIFTFGFTIAYPLAVLVVMFLPNVAAAFSRSSLERDDWPARLD